MINAKTAQRIAFAEDYEGDDYERNPQLKFTLAKSIEPEEVRYKLAKARAVQQAIIMQTESQTSTYDTESYANLQPKVFRNQSEGRRLKDIGVVISHQTEEKERRFKMLNRMREEKKQMRIDISKGASKISYVKFFKPPKPQQVNSQGQSLSAYEKKQVDNEGTHKLMKNVQNNFINKLSNSLKEIPGQQSLEEIVIQQNQRNNHMYKSVGALRNQSQGYQYYGHKYDEDSEGTTDEERKKQKGRNVVLKQFEEPKIQFRPMIKNYS